MPSQEILTRHLCLAADVEKYSTLDTPQQEAVQADLVRLLDEAAVLSGLDRSSWSRQAQGDQEFAVLPTGITEAVVLGEFVRHLAYALDQRNVSRRARERMRLRLAIDVGVARTAALGHSGPTPVSVSRYVNADPLRDVMKATTTASIGVLISDHLFQDVVRSRDHGLDPDQYTRVHVQQGEFSGYGWVQVPGHDPSTVRGLPADGAASPQRTPPPVPRLRQPAAVNPNTIVRHLRTTVPAPRSTRMSTPAEIAALAASTVVGAMATDTWSYVRGRCAALFHHHASEESAELLQDLDDFEEDVAHSEPDERQELVASITDRATDVFKAIATRSDGAANAVRELSEAMDAKSTKKVSHGGQSYQNIRTGGGDFITSGGDTNITGKH